jgi:MATE family multidrug resistance protein
LNKKILNLAIPNIISNVTIPLLGLVDMALMGHLNSNIYIGSIALGGVIFNFLYWMFSFLRMGTSGFTAQAYGQKDNTESYGILGRAVFIALISGLLLILLQYPLEWIAFHFLEGSQEVKALACEYFKVRIWAAPATIGLYAFTGWFIGMQDARIPMIIAITSNILNIVFSAIFVFIFNMNSAGVALGTLIAQYIGLIVAIWFIHRKFSDFYKSISIREIINSSALIKFMKVNGDIFIRTLCVIGVFTFFTSKSAGINDTTLAVNSILLQFLMFFAFFMDGFAYAGEALSGKYFGAKDIIKLKHVTKNLFGWGLIIGVIFSLAYLLFGDLIISLITSDTGVRRESAQYILWAAIVPLTSFAAFVWDGIFIGATASRGMRNSMLITTFLLFVPSYFLFYNTMGNHALWLSMNLFLFGRGLFQTIIAKKHVFKRVENS